MQLNIAATTVTITDAELDAFAQLIATYTANKLAAAAPAPAPVPAPVPTPAPTPAPVLTYKAEPARGIRVLQALEELRVDTGEYAGMFLLAPAGYGNWYFANLGLLGAIPHMDSAALAGLVKPYLNLYISKLRADYTIDDVSFPGGIAFPTSFALHVSDSDDSYGATFASLALAYVKASGDTAWLDGNKARINAIVDSNCVVPIKANNLTSTFTPTNTQKQWTIGYFMDNCEVYRGLRDCAELNDLASNTTLANYFDSAADRVAQGLRDLWAATGFRYADALLMLRSPGAAESAVLYPDGACQVFAQVFGITELADLYTPAYAYLNNNFPNWEAGGYDPFPFAVIGYAAALRGDAAKATAQLALVENKFALDRGKVTLNELGWYAKTRAILYP